MREENKKQERKPGQYKGRKGNCMSEKPDKGKQLKSGKQGNKAGRYQNRTVREGVENLRSQRKANIRERSTVRPKQRW